MAARDAIAAWARESYGWIGRSPDYKAAFLASLGANADFYAPYEDNARRWYKKVQEEVSFVNHAIVNPPVEILTQEQQDLSTYFAGGWKDATPPPFALEPWHGGPLLARSSAVIGCAIDTISEGGDHFIVVGKVLAVYRSEPVAAPLVFSAGRYAALAMPPKSSERTGQG